MSRLKQTRTSMDWRKQLQVNNRRTYVVIALFIILYACVGFLIDLFIHVGGIHAALTGNNPTSHFATDQITVHRDYLTLSLPETAYRLVTGYYIPWATLIFMGIGVISLLITYAFHNRLMLSGTQYVEARSDSTDPDLKRLFNVVEEMKVASGMNYMPKVYMIEAQYMNAFATGFNEKSSMIAVTRGLYEKLDRAELQAVMAHELSHIRHGDIKLTLTASVLANLMVMALDFLFYGIIFGRRRDNRGANILALIIIIARFVLPIITVLLMLYLSRTREYMADAGCVELQRDNEPLARALIKINQDHHNNAKAYHKAYSSTAHEAVRRQSYIFDPGKAGLLGASSPADWFSTHPSLENRLEALGYKQEQQTSQGQSQAEQDKTDS